MKIILASKSPRRKELLGKLFSSFDIITKDVDETVPNNLHPRYAVEILALRKGAAVAEKDIDSLVISSDTLVEYDGIALGKPKNREDAVRMLGLLSGKTHNVHTGVAVHYKGRSYSGIDTTAVTFRTLSEEEIESYVDTGEPMDKAGAYGIQGLGGRLVSDFDGNYDTVVGLSLSLTEKLVSKAILEGE